MKRIAILTLSLALTIMALSLTTVRADTDSVRYSFIIGRNPFSLTTITARVEISPPPVVPPPPLATVELTGVISIPFPRALLEILPGPGKPLIKPILTEGQKVESIELVSIDIDRGQVTIKNNGVLTNILLKIAKASTPGMSSADTGSRGRQSAPPTISSVSAIPPRMMRSPLSQSPRPDSRLSPAAAVIDLEHSRRSNPASFPPLPPTALSQH